MKRVSVLIMRVCVMCCLGVILSTDCSSETIVVYPNIDGLGETGFGYQMMDLVLKKSGKSYQLQLDPPVVNTSRAFSRLDDGYVSVVDCGTEISLEERFDAVYIPIDRGLLGWRLFIINKNQTGDFAQMKTLKQLQTKVAGQGIGWPDVTILEKAGLQVMTSSHIENLIKMVDGGRFDFFPLGVGEIYGFLRLYGANLPNLIIEDSLVLVYPFGQFFFVKKGNKELHADITIGLENAYADGSFQELVINHPFAKEGLSKAHLETRTVINIENPLMSEAFKNIDPKWWYRLK